MRAVPRFQHPLVLNGSDLGLISCLASTSDGRLLCYSGCLKGVSKPVQVLLDGIEAVLVLTLIILK